jgi:iron complex transport system substrate-binding protein
MLKRTLQIAVILLCLSFNLVNAQDDGYTVVDAYGKTITIYPQDLERIISIGGAVTEILYDLGLGDQIIAVDVSSLYPDEVLDLPTVGYLRFLSPEPILAFNPSIIISTEDIGPPETLNLIQSVGVPVLIVPAQDTLQGTEDKIRTIATGVGKIEAGEAIIQQMQLDIAHAQQVVEQIETKPRVLFVFVGSSIAIGVLGPRSGGHHMLELINAENAILIDDSYIPLTAEAVVAAAPDVILTTTLSIERAGGLEKFMQIPGISLTPAVMNDRVIYEGLDDLFLLGFTPRLGDAILTLTYLIHDELPRSVSAIIRIENRIQKFEEDLKESGLIYQFDDQQEYTILAPVDAVIKAGDIDLSAYILDGKINVDQLDIDPSLVIETIEASNGFVHIINGTIE